ncbi:sensor histidine kinase [Thiomicrorhabdus aquaedulcis]|uniref:sensor histidine kinase n=1 Tax=Thiomicrorhabdus aquaedulcis TaxID=2211106 RepID=UPI000FD77AC4|nr:sensor histidine kinase [Thiomicrorhabdus aquaedulcis]
MLKIKNVVIQFIVWNFLWMLVPSALASQAHCLQKINLAHNMEVWIDANKHTSFSEATRQVFKPANGDFSFGMSQAAIWIKLQLQPPQACVSPDQAWLLRFNAPYHDTIDAYWQEDDGQLTHWQGGDQSAHHSQSVSQRLPTIAIPLNPQKARTVYVRLTSQNTLNASMDLIAKDEFERHELTILLASSLIAALIFIALCMALINAVIFKEWSFLYYAGFTTTITVVMTIVHGWSNVLWPMHLSDAFITLAQGWTMVFFVLVSNALLKIRQHIKYVYYTQITLAILAAIWSVIAVSLEQYRWSIPISHFLGSMIMLSLVITAVWIRKREPMANVYIVAFVLTIMALMTRLSMLHGLLPVNFWTENSVIFALILPVLLFLMGLMVQTFQEKQLRRCFEIQARQLQEEVKKRTTFMNLLSHELMNPLAIMDVTVRNMQEDLPASHTQQQSQLQKQSKAIQRMRQIVDVCLSKEHCATHQNQTTFLVVDFWRMVQSQFNEQGDAQRVNWHNRTTDIASTSSITHQTTTFANPNYTNATIKGPIEPLIMAVQLIVQNALKYSACECHITLECFQNTAVIEVRDWGIGFDPALLSPKPFERGQNVMHLQGLGLGLTVAKDLIDGADGSLKIEPQKDGTLIKLNIPVSWPT